MTSLMVAGLAWKDVFVILGTSATVSLLVSEPHEVHKKAIRIAEKCLII